MTLSLAMACYLVAVILFILSALPVVPDYRLERWGFVFFAAGHLL
jgi:hypothetical protein